MATPAIQAEYAQEAADFAAELAENGHLASFGSLGDGARPDDPPLGYVELGTAHVFPSEWQADFSGDVRSDDKFYFVGATVDMESCTHMDTKASKIVLAKPFKPDGVTVIYYEIQVRS